MMMMTSEKGRERESAAKVTANQRGRKERSEKAGRTDRQTHGQTQNKDTWLAELAPDRNWV